jgi:DNA-binding LacI/PurR family transcriptional regulator
MTNKIVTIIDVARQAGVSPATVSHALNGKRPVGAETRDKILKVIDKLGYVPSWNASRLKEKKSGIIGCIAADITETFVNQIVRGIEMGLPGGGYSLLFASSLEFGNDFQATFNFLRSHRVDGVLFCQHIPGWNDFSKEALKAGIPIISINQECEGILSIVPDNYKGGYQAAEHLLSCGSKNPVFIGGPESRISSQRRFEGFSDKLKSIGKLQSNANNGEFTFNHGFDTTIRLMSEDPSIDGLFCANDYIACGAEKALRTLGIKVPDKVKLIGYDNRDFSEFWNIPITTFKQHFESMGLLAISLMKSEIASGTTESKVIRIPSEMIPRESSGFRA